MNREEVDKCKQIAKNALASGNPEKAVKFLEKAKRMDPDDSSLDAMIAQAMSGEASAPSGDSGSAGAGPSSAPPPSYSEGPRQRTRAATSDSTTSSGPTRINKDGGKYTTEQMQLVQRILRTKDYYDILGIPKDSHEDDVKKAYKKLALKLHPDKNKAPGAEEAFKKVSKAVQCLQDADKKQVYDRYGDEEHMPQQHRQRYQQDFMTPEDLFAAFFGGGAFHAQGGGFHQRQHHGGGEDGDGVPRAQLFQMLPVLLLVFLTLASNFAGRETGSRFSFQQTGSFQNERSTATLNVNYFVTNDFEQYYSEGTKNMADFERQVETYYVRQLHSDCDYQEKVMYKKVMIAKRRGDQQELEKARNHPRPACKDIDKIKRRHPSIYRQALYMGGF
jgi:hypothetical protein